MRTVDYTKVFKKHVNKYSKKYPSTKKTIKSLVDTLLDTGAEMIPSLINLGDNYYKLRLACIERNKGKSAGFRVAFFEDRGRFTLLALWMHPDVSHIKKEKLIKIYEKHVSSLEN